MTTERSARAATCGALSVIRSIYQAYRISCQTTARFMYGGMTLCCAIGAIVDGVEVTFQTPLSGHRSPVRAVVPIGFRVWPVVGITTAPFR